jgi:lysozyme family protein
MGTSQAVLISQKALNYLGESLAEDGEIGPKPIEALNRWSVKDERALLVCLNGFQFIRYVEIKKNNPSQVKFTRGWTKRIQGYKEV